MTAQKGLRPLSAEAFGKFLRWLSDDDEQAVMEYQAIRRRLVRYFINKGCTEADDLFDETVDIVLGKIDSGEEIVSPLAYCYGVARNVWRQWVRRHRTVPVTRDFVSLEPEDSNAGEQELRCLEHCVSQLPQEERDVVTRYHASHGREQIEVRKALASGKGGVNALRIRMCRIRKHLRLCVTDCLERSAKAMPFGVQGK